MRSAQACLVPVSQMHHIDADIAAGQDLLVCDVEPGAPELDDPAGAPACADACAARRAAYSRQEQGDPTMARLARHLLIVPVLLFCISAPVEAEEESDRLLKKLEAIADIEQKVMVPMRDGVRLATDVYRLSGAAPAPVLLARTPYDKERIIPASRTFDILRAVQAGYVVAASVLRLERTRTALRETTILSPISGAG